jgi:catechol 2,3-dioxygenase-like lactoylglutathione lyase family enzyme
MKLEHIAFDVPDPEAMIAWWCTHLGFRRTAPGFIADDSGAMCLEIYRAGATAAPPDYAAAHAMTMHIAFVSADVRGDADRLAAAGARLESIQTEDPDFHVAGLRDPWGVPIQLCRRAKSVFLA